MHSLCNIGVRCPHRPRFCAARLELTDRVSILGAGDSTRCVQSVKERVFKGLSLIDRAPIECRAVVREVQVARSGLPIAVRHRLPVRRKAPLLSGDHLPRTVVLESCATGGVGNTDFYPREYGLVSLHMPCPRSGRIVNGQVVERDVRYDVSRPPPRSVTPSAKVSEGHGSREGGGGAGAVAIVHDYA